MSKDRQTEQPRPSPFPNGVYSHYFWSVMVNLRHSCRKIPMVQSDRVEATDRPSIPQPSPFPNGVYIYRFSIHTSVTNLLVESAACMPQNLILELIQSLFLVNDGKSAAFVPQNSNGVTDGRRATDRPSYPNLLRSQMGYIVCFPE